MDLLPLLLLTQAESYLAQGKVESAALPLAAAVRLRKLLNIPSSLEEQEDLNCIADTVRQQHVEGLLTTLGAQFLAVNMEELLSKLLSLFESRVAHAK